MKLHKLLYKCRVRLTQHIAIGYDGRAYAGPDLIAEAVLELLGGKRPNAVASPVVVTMQGHVGMVRILDGGEDPKPACQLTPIEARWFAAELLRAADAAEELVLSATQGAVQ